MLKKWDPDTVKDYYDSHPNITLHELSAYSGLTKAQLKSHIKSNEWNQVHIKVVGNRMQHFVNGVLMSEVTDLDTKNISNKGYIGVQVHTGPPMKVEYKNIRLKVIL